MNSDQEDVRRAYQRAEKVVAEKVGFYRHAIIFAAVSGIMFGINAAISPEFYWSLLLIGAWAVALLAHFLSVFIFQGGGFERWRKKQIEREVKKRLRTD